MPRKQHRRGAKPVKRAAKAEEEDDDPKVLNQEEEEIKHCPKMPKKEEEEVVVAPAVPKAPKELALPKVTNWRNKIFYHVAISGAVIYGHLQESISASLEQCEYEERRLNRNIKHGFGVQPHELQERIEIYRFPRALHSAPDAPRDGSSYLEHTRTYGVIEGLEVRLRARVLDVIPHLSASISGLLKDTEDKRERDNLCHLYALFVPYPRIKSEVERLFLWLLTGTDPRNAEGVLIRKEAIDMLCLLHEVEGLFGLPMLRQDGAGTNYDRYSKLDLSHMVADLIDALQRQTVTKKFARPVMWSLACDDGYQNIIKPAVGTFYVIQGLTSPHYAS